MTPHRFSASVLALALVLGGAAVAQTAPAAPDTAAPAASAGDDISGTYTFSPDHSQIVFSYKHMGFSKSYGFINGVQGKVTLDKANPQNSTVEASFPLSAIRTIDAALDKTLFSDEFLKGQAPDTLVTFKSTRVEPDDDDEAKVIGDLTLNGVTKSVTLDVDLNKAGVNPMLQKPAVGFSIEADILRSDFNLGAFAPAVSDKMEIDINIEAVKG